MIILQCRLRPANECIAQLNMTMWQRRGHTSSSILMNRYYTLWYVIIYTTRFVCFWLYVFPPLSFPSLSSVEDNDQLNNLIDPRASVCLRRSSSLRYNNNYYYYRYFFFLLFIIIVVNGPPRCVAVETICRENEQQIHIRINKWMTEWWPERGKI